MTEVMEQVRKELDDLFIALGKANCPLSNSIIRQVLIKAILKIPEILIKDPDQSLILNRNIPYRGNIKRLLVQQGWVKVLEEKWGE
ncbi:hypothetical protein ES703_101125 [subsurface metagenome]